MPLQLWASIPNSPKQKLTVLSVWAICPPLQKYYRNLTLIVCLHPWKKWQLDSIKNESPQTIWGNWTHDQSNPRQRPESAWTSKSQRQPPFWAASILLFGYWNAEFIPLRALIPHLHKPKAAQEQFEPLNQSLKLCNLKLFHSLLWRLKREDI